jgi:hypothetical protein
MNKKQCKHELARVWPALAMMATIWLAGAAGGWAAEPLATPGTNADPAVVLDDTTLWRQFHVAGPSGIRGADGGLVRANVEKDGGVGSRKQLAAAFRELGGPDV